MARSRAEIVLWCGMTALCMRLSHAQPSVTTWHNDNTRTGQNLQESTLTTANVNSSTFGKLFTISVDGKVDAQPLYVPSLAIPANGIHDALFVVTEHDSAYAFDADLGTQLWHVSVLGSGETTSDDRGCSQVTPEIGITSTPVIDTQSGPHGTMYLVAMSKDASGNYHHRLHALDLTTGAEQFGGPTEIQATYAGTGAEGSAGLQTFDPKQHKDRPALIVANGVVYTSWGSHCDIAPYTGWVMGYDETTLAQVSLTNLTPNGSDGGIWSAGSGPAADAGGNIFLLLGNGTFDTALNAAGFPDSNDYGNAFVRLTGNLAVTDYFTMLNTVSESDGDADLGSGGTLLLPPLNDAQGRPRVLAVGGGKDQNMYVVDRNNLGKFHANMNGIYQDLTGSLGGGLFSSPAWFNGSLYYGASGDHLKSFVFTNGVFNTTPTTQSTEAFEYPGATPSISANGTANGIVWAVENSGTAILHAYDATNLANELYNSNQAPNGRDQFGAGNKFIVPTIANGKVYIGTTNGVGVLGLLCSFAFTQQSVAVPPAGATGAVTLQNSPGCAWNAVSNASWLTRGPASGSGSASITYTASANNTGAARSATITIGGQVFTVTQPNLVQSPAPLYVSPAAGSGSTRSFVFNFTDPRGWQDLDVVDVLIQSALDGRHACYIAYSRPLNVFYLVNDAGDALLPAISATANASVSNSQCTITSNPDSATGSGSLLSLVLNIAFTPAFSGNKILFEAAADVSQNNSGWQTIGAWTVPGAAAASPAVIGVGPARASSPSQTFMFSFSDSGGWQQLGVVDILLNTALNGQAACYLAYSVPLNTLYLVNDAGTGLLPGLNLGGSGSLSNSQCTIEPGSMANGSGNTLTLTLTIAPSATFAGSRTFYLAALDGAGGDSGWQPSGTWTVP